MSMRFIEMMYNYSFDVKWSTLLFFIKNWGKNKKIAQARLGEVKKA